MRLWFRPPLLRRRRRGNFAVLAANTKREQTPQEKEDNITTFNQSLNFKTWNLKRQQT
jgi:hypothetical protein